jgi:ribonuclease T1
VLVIAPSGRRAAAVLVAAVVALSVLSGCGRGTSSASTADGTPPASGRPGVSTSPSDAAALAPAAAVSGLPTMTVSQLPPEGVTTLRLIAAGGPFPYSKDGVTFSNREGLLPRHPSGWYQEYTVVTPGSSDRGARRIIAGKDGGRFYTSDHYASFREVLSGVSS